MFAIILNGIEEDGKNMECIKMVDNARFTVELVSSITKLYTYKGKDFYYEEILKNFMKNIISETIEKDVKYAARFLDLKVSDARMRSLLKKDSEPKTRDERIVSKLKGVFTLVQKIGTDLNLDSNEFLMLGTRIFEDDKKFGFAYTLLDSQMGLVTEKKRVSKRDEFQVEITAVKKALEDDEIEATQVITRYFIDALKQEYFTDYNEFMAILSTYCLLVSRRFNVFKYVSFFEFYYNKIEEFTHAIAKASYGYNEGFSDITELNNVIINLMIEGYKTVEGMTQDSRFNKDIKINKIDAACSAILSLGQNFTKNDIKEKCPYMSDSTINRALETLKESGKIISNGTGRSATWTKLIDNMDLSRRDRQINIFDMIGNED